MNRSGSGIRIAMLTTRFPPDYGGGARHALGLCRKLAARGVDSFVLTGHRARSIAVDQVEGISVTRLPASRGTVLRTPSLYARRLDALLRQRSRYDVIHAHAVHHHAYAGFLAGQLLRKPAIAKIALLGGDDPAAVARRRLGWVQLRLLKRASALVATSSEMVQAVLGFGWPEAHLAHIPNGVDIDRFAPLGETARADLRLELDIPTDALVVAFVGLIVRRKGVHLLARTWSAVRKACPDALLLLVGPCSSSEHWGVDDDYVREVRSILSQGEVIDSVRFVGMVSNPQVYMQASDVFAFPTLGEGMPNALLEAMACGLPFVATRLGCIEEVAPPEQEAYLVPAGDIDPLVEAIASLANDRHARQALSAVVRRTVELHFSLEATADRYIDLYRTLLGVA